MSAYPKAGKVGGTLIRRVVATFRAKGVALPLKGPVFIAVSGGVDSVALAHLLVFLGRKVAPRERLGLLHINHGWRAGESDADEAWVTRLAADWGVALRTVSLRAGRKSSLKEDADYQGASWEEVARSKRKEVYQKIAEEGGVVLTAHHADDVAETVLWRLCTGAFLSHGAGILFSHESELRPCLRIRKRELISYLEEVGQSFCQDATNFDPRFLRAKMRSKLMPELEALFPRAVDHICQVAESFEVGQKTSKGESGNHLELLRLFQELFFNASGLHLRRSHLNTLSDKFLASDRKSFRGEIHLPGGWKLIRESKKND